jgi:transposase-like protein
MAGGRPTKYRDEICDEIIPLFKQGMSIHEVCLELGIHYDTFNEWRKDEKKQLFSEAVKNGLALSQGWWEAQARKGMWKDKESNLELNPTLWFMNMKNRLSTDWRDRQEVKQDIKQETTHIEADFANRKD